MRKGTTITINSCALHLLDTNYIECTLCPCHYTHNSTHLPINSCPCTFCHLKFPLFALANYSEKFFASFVPLHSKLTNLPLFDYCFAGIFSFVLFCYAQVDPFYVALITVIQQQRGCSKVINQLIVDTDSLSTST